MLEVAFAIGIFSYSIFLFGLLGFLYPILLIPYTLIYWLVFGFTQRQQVVSFFKKIQIKTYSPFFLCAVGYLVLQAAMNAIPLFGPEIGFDATWYHLTLPKLYLMYHAVVHIPGGVLYYSDMPKVAEMLYTAGLSFGSDFFARIWQLLLGICTCVILYKIGRKFFSPNWAILLPVIFYSNLVVGWESSSGYVDLVRTFFTTIALFTFLQWRQTKEQKYFISSAVFVGLTIATKLLALPDIVMYSVALFFLDIKTLTLWKRIQRIVVFFAVALLCVLPWLVFAYIHTGNPIYPMLSTAYPVGNYWQILSPVFLLTSLWTTFAVSSDPINPLFLALGPFIVLYYKKLWKEIPLITFFALSGIVIWYITPQTGGGRYILPYLSAVSLLCIFLIRLLHRNWQKLFVICILVAAFVSLGYRALAASKLFPLFFHQQTQAQYMTSHLQFNLGDFYDIDGYFAHHIKPTDTVLLYGFHNLYYVNFPFVDSNWVKSKDAFTYVAVQGTGMPDRFQYWNLVYFNATTQVRLYQLGHTTWFY